MPGIHSPDFAKAPAGDTLQTRDEPAKRYDAGKPRVDLIPADAMLEVGRVFGWGANKYSRKETVVWKDAGAWVQSFLANQFPELQFRVHTRTGREWLSGYAGLAMTKTSNAETLHTRKDSPKTSPLGTGPIPTGAERTKPDGSPTPKNEQSLTPSNESPTYEEKGLAARRSSGSGSANGGDALFAAEPCLQSQRFMWITAMAGAGSEESYAVDATTASECLAKALKLCGERFSTSKTLLLPSVENSENPDSAVLRFSGEHNWTHGMSWSRVIGSLERHTLALKSGEDYDPESKLSHAGHIAWNALVLISYLKRSVGRDDRFKEPQANVQVAEKTRPEGPQADESTEAEGLKAFWQIFKHILSNEETGSGKTSGLFAPAIGENPGIQIQGVSPEAEAAFTAVIEIAKAVFGSGETLPEGIPEYIITFHGKAPEGFDKAQREESRAAVHHAIAAAAREENFAAAAREDAGHRNEALRKIFGPDHRIFQFEGRGVSRVVQHNGRGRSEFAANPEDATRRIEQEKFDGLTRRVYAAIADRDAGSHSGNGCKATPDWCDKFFAAIRNSGSEGEVWWHYRSPGPTYHIACATRVREVYYALPPAERGGFFWGTGQLTTYGSSRVFDETATNHG